MVCDCLGLLGGGGLDWKVRACPSAIPEPISESSARLLRLLGSAFWSPCKDSDCLSEACCRSVLGSSLVLNLFGVTRSVGIEMVGWAIFRGEVGGGLDNSGVGSVKKLESA